MQTSGGIAGKVALVTGASSGIGEAAAVALAAEGVHVVVTARRAQRLEHLVGRLGGEAVALPGDVSDEAFATEAVEETVRRFGRLDILVNSAGVIQAGHVGGADLGEWRRVIDVNLLATLYTCAAAVPHMKTQGSGDIINISSTAGRRTNGTFGPYNVSKTAVNSLSEGLRQEVGLNGIRVCIVEPGATTTEVAEGMSDPALREAIRTHVSKEGAMSPADVAGAIVFQCRLPRRANLAEILLVPTNDVTPM